MSEVNLELQRSAIATISLGETAVRKLAGIPSGTISFSSLYNKALEITVVIPGDNYSFDSSIHLYPLVVNALGGRSLSDTEVVIVTSGIKVSYSTAVPCFDFRSWPYCRKLTLVNNGEIVGRGGNGGEAGQRWSNPGYPGGAAIGLPPYRLLIQNNGLLSGGGGGGGANNGYDWVGSGNTCLSENTYVLLYSGQRQLISQIQPGDIVLSHNGERCVPAKVKSLKPAGKKRAFKIYSNSFYVVCSAEHPFATENGWAAVDSDLMHYLHPEIENVASSLTKGSTLIDSHSRRVEIEGILDTDEFIEMYTIDIEDATNTFFASGDGDTFVLTHNKGDK